MRPANATYVDGILKLHAQLDEACRLAYDYSKKFFNNPDPIEHEERKYNLFVDFSETQPSNAVKGYFVFNHTIHRFLNITLDYAVLFPVRDHSGWDDAVKRKGIKIAQILELQRNREKVLITLSLKKDSRVSQPLYVASVQTENDGFSLLKNVIDDIGQPYYSFPDINCLQVVKLPKAMKSTSFTLVGKQYYAPLSTDKECYCVLFAQIDNEYDSNAIKVLRWFPEKRTTAGNNRRTMISAKHKVPFLSNMSDQPMRSINTTSMIRERKIKIIELEGKIKRLSGFHGHCFFELGHISRNENTALHKFMVENNTRILFGNLNSGRISLMGGIDIFFDHDFDFPASLSTIPIK